MSNNAPYKIFAIGDSALTIDFGNRIDELLNQQVIARFTQFSDSFFPGLIELVPAYSTLTVYYDPLVAKKNAAPGMTGRDWVEEQVTGLLAQPVVYTEEITRLVEIPVCYEPAYGTDLQELANAKQLTIDEVIHIHSAVTYKVYLLGFMPGFPYMGETDKRIAMPRRTTPKPVMAGSVGIAGQQTGIYPLESPGGWQIIGRTPVKLFDPIKEPSTVLRPGDRVRFIPITSHEFENY